MFPGTENKEQNWLWVIVLRELIFKINHECAVSLPVALTSISFSRYAWVQVVISYQEETYVIPRELEVALLDLIVW